MGFEAEKIEVEQAYPHLHFSVVDGQVTVTGSMEIKEGHKVLDRFSVEIRLPENYPESVPVVFETGGRIPRIRDRHCYDDTGAACLFLPEERWRVWPKGKSLLQFIDGPVRNYFISQSVFERDGVWPFGQWDHGLDGRKQFYQEIFGTDDLVKVKKYFEFLAAKKVKGHWDCPCGSGKRVRNCHFELVRSLRNKIPRSDASKAIRPVDEALQRQSKKQT